METFFFEVIIMVYGRNCDGSPGNYSKSAYYNKYDNAFNRTLARDAYYRSDTRRYNPHTSVVCNDWDEER